ncbi:MAG: hypothetical protein MRY32_01330 [Rickettsiales bacterium]|nr:hypothetical protein [Rickettsiales bacterium]
MSTKRDHMQRQSQRADAAERREMTERLAEERGVEVGEITNAEVTTAIEAARKEESQRALRDMLEQKLGRGQG